MNAAPTLAAVRGFSCPVCGAAPGARCLGMAGRLRETNHPERTKALLTAKTDRRRW